MIRHQLVLIFSLLLSACTVSSPLTAVPTREQSPTETPIIIPSSTSTPTNTSTPEPTQTSTETPTPVDSSEVLNNLITSLTDEKSRVKADGKIGVRLENVPRSWNASQRADNVAAFGDGGEKIVNNIENDWKELQTDFRNGIYIKEVDKEVDDNGYSLQVIEEGKEVWAVDAIGNFLPNQGAVGKDVEGYRPIPESPIAGDMIWGVVDGCTVLMVQNKIDQVRAVFYPSLGTWKEIPIPEVKLAPVGKEKVTSAGEGLDNNMQPKNPERLYQEVINAFATSKVNQDFWKDFNVDPTEFDVYKFIRDYIGSDGEGYWLPLISPNGINLKILRSKMHAAAEFTDWEPVINDEKIEAVKMDGVRDIMFSHTDWENDTGMIQELRANLDEINGELPYSADTTAAVPFDDHVYEFGMVVTPDQRLAILAGNEQPVPEKHQNLAWFTFGGLDGTFDPNQDPKIATAMWETTIVAYKDLYENDWRLVPVCFTLPDICQYGVLISDIKDGHEIFEPKNK